MILNSIQLGEILHRDEKTIRRWKKQGMPYYMSSGKHLYDLKEVMCWLEIDDLESYELKIFPRHIKNLSEAKKGEKNPIWKYDDVQYSALHAWVKRNSIKPKICNDCKKERPLDLANISQEYKRDLSDWEWLCRKCHMTKDNRLEKFSKLTRGGGK